MWVNHSFTYDAVARNPRVKTSAYSKARVQTLMEVGRNLFAGTRELGWDVLNKARNERRPAYFWTAEPTGAELRSFRRHGPGIRAGLEDLQRVPQRLHHNKWRPGHSHQEGAARPPTALGFRRTCQE